MCCTAGSEKPLIHVYLAPGSCMGYEDAVQEETPSPQAPPERELAEKYLLDTVTIVQHPTDLNRLN